MGSEMCIRDRIKHAFPFVFYAYAARCQRGELHPGVVAVHSTATNPRYIVSFPTKQHWRNPSKLEWINSGLIDLRRAIDDFGIKSIAIPPLGCGLGGLAWQDVRELIVSRLGDIDVDVVLYVPRAS